MDQQEIINEYFEDVMEEQSQPQEEVVFIEEDMDAPYEVVEAVPGTPSSDEEAYVISFSEEDLSTDYDEELAEQDLSEVAEDLEEEIEDLQDLGEEYSEDQAVDQSVRYIPGASEPIVEEEAPPEDDDVETNWADDRDTSKFIDYLRDGYSSIPAHSGNSISGCERALVYLNGLNKEISEAVRKDGSNNLDPFLDEIEDYRVKILQGMVALKNRIGELKKKIKEEGSQKKRSEDDSDEFIKESVSPNEDITKEATTANLQVVITPFERAVTGILVNSVVSAGHPFEDVYEYLKDKFDLSAREELAILQIVMDMGFPIFKDRGTIGSDVDGENQDGHGIDFIKNYFA